MVAPAVGKIFIIEAGTEYRAPRHTPGPNEHHEIPERGPQGPDLQIVPIAPEVDIEKQRRDEAIIRGGLLENWDEITNDRPKPETPIYH